MARRTLKQYNGLWTVLLLGAMILGACNFPPKSVVVAPSVGDETILQANSFYAEIGAAVIAKGANPACPDGKVFIATAENNFPGILLSDLSQSGQTVNVTPIPASKFSIGMDDKFGSADILIETLPKGGLLVVMQGGTTAALNPQPDWWDVYSKNSKTNPFFTDGHRGALHLWRSSDCGNSWQRLADIDSASTSIAGGKCAYPQLKKDGTPTRGGFDREELYVDPWTGRIFLTTGCMGGGYDNYPVYQRGLVFTSDNSGDSWTVAKTDELPTGELSRHMAIVMTSVYPSGRLYLLQCKYIEEYQQWIPVLYWMDSPWNSVEGGWEIYFGTKEKPGEDCDLLKKDQLSAKVTQARVFPPSLSRIYSNALGDALRVAFPTINNGRQAARIVNIFVDPSDIVKAVPLYWIKAEDPGGDIINATFVETDRFQLKLDTNMTMMYWLESNAKGELFVRFAIAGEQPTAWTASADLSRLGGTRHSWMPKVNDFVGDYLNGSFFAQDQKLIYLGAWSVVSEQQVRYNIVSLPNPVKMVNPNPGNSQAMPMNPVPVGPPQQYPPGILQDSPEGEEVELVHISAEASVSLPDAPAANVLDRDRETVWNAGTGPEQWIQVNLGMPTTVTEIRLFVSQYPEGDTIHQIWVGSNPERLALLHEFRGRTKDLDVLEFTPRTPLLEVQFIRVVTLVSPSWVSWREIQIETR